MSVTDIEKLAAQGSEMPASLNAPEQLLFLSLRHLYAMYRSGKIAKDSARAEKNMIYAEYEKNVLSHKCWVNALEKERKLQHITQDIKSCSCDTCLKYLRILEGIA